MATAVPLLERLGRDLAVMAGGCLGLHRTRPARNAARVTGRFAAAGGARAGHRLPCRLAAGFSGFAQTQRRGHSRACSATGSPGDAAKAGTDAAGTAAFLPERVSGASGGSHCGSRADRTETAGGETTGRANRAGATERHEPARAKHGAECCARTELRRTRDEASGYARSEDAETEQGQARKDEAHRLADIGLMSLQGGRELGEIVRADADDDREHHHLDAGTDDIAQHALGGRRCGSRRRTALG